MNSQNPLPQHVTDTGDAQLLNIERVAQLLICSPRHVRRLADRGAMPAPVRLGHLVRWRAADIDSWISNGCPDCPRKASYDE